MTLKDYLFGSPIRTYPTEPYHPKLLSCDEITPQIQTDLDYTKRLDDRLTFLSSQGYEKIIQHRYWGRRYEDETIRVCAHDYVSESAPVHNCYLRIAGKVKETNQEVIIVNTDIASNEGGTHYESYYISCVNDYHQHYTPIVWNCSDECKQNILQYIEDNIFNINVVPLKDQFCKQLSEIKK
jgi:hypothetical protein